MLSQEDIAKARKNNAERERLERAVAGASERIDALRLELQRANDEYDRAYAALRESSDAERTSAHHRDCDGYRLEHRVTLDRQRTTSAHTPFLYSAVCEECGPLHIGSYGSERHAQSIANGHSREVACDGRCRDWS